jgi:hypothetical protein
MGKEEKKAKERQEEEWAAAAKKKEEEWLWKGGKGERIREEKEQGQIHKEAEQALEKRLKKEEDHLEEEEAEWIRGEEEIMAAGDRGWRGCQEWDARQSSQRIHTSTSTPIRLTTPFARICWPGWPWPVSSDHQQIAEYTVTAQLANLWGSHVWGAGRLWWRWIAVQRCTLG